MQQRLEPHIARMAIKESEAPAGGDKGLQAGALGLVGNVVIGLSSVAPAYRSGRHPGLRGA